ncbi:hypothetical protein GCM10025779_08890 [Arthrobacter cryoconiti]
MIDQMVSKKFMPSLYSSTKQGLWDACATPLCIYIVFLFCEEPNICPWQIEYTESHNWEN